MSEQPLSSQQSRLVALLAASERTYELLPIVDPDPQRLRRPIAVAAAKLLAGLAAPRVLVVVSRPGSARDWCHSWERATTMRAGWPDAELDGGPSEEQLTVATVSDISRHQGDYDAVDFDLVVSDRLADYPIWEGPIQRLGKRHWQLVSADAILEQTPDAELGTPGRFLIGDLFEQPGPRERLSGLAERILA